MTQRTPFRRIDQAAARSLANRGGLLLFDVRDAQAFARGRIGDARHLSMANLSARFEPTPRDAPILIYCYRGHASQEYAQIFSDFGFTQVYSLDGGYEAWQKAPGAAPVPDDALRSWLTGQGFPADDIDATIANRTTAAMKASHLGEVEMLDRLIAAGANFAQRNADGNTALWFACVGNHPGLLDRLIAAGVDLDNRNDNGATALMYCASTGKAALVDRLLQAGADPTLATLDDFTALDMAATLECLTLLRRTPRRTEAANPASAAGRSDAGEGVKTG